MDLGKLLPRKKETPNYVKHPPEPMKPGFSHAPDGKLIYNPLDKK